MAEIVSAQCSTCGTISPSSSPSTDHSIPQSAALRRPRNEIIVGIDNGIDRCVVSWTMFSTTVPPDRLPSHTTYKVWMRIVTDWQNAYLCYRAVPSMLAYTSDIHGNPQELLWGHDVLDMDEATREQSIVVDEFRSIFHEGQENSLENLELRQSATRLGKIASDFQIDFLRKLKEHLDVHFAKMFLGRANFRYKINTPHLTVPAMQSFGQCCLAAGFKEEETSFESEIEAIFVACNKSPDFCLAPNGEVKKHYKVHVVVYADHCTMDAASYKINATSPCLIAEELSVSEGLVSCGVKNLTLNSAQLAEKRMKDYERLDFPWLKKFLQNDFVRCLRPFMDKFDGSESFIQGINTSAGWAHIKARLEPLDLLRGNEFNDIFVSNFEIRSEVFDPVIAAIVELIQKQLNFLHNHDPKDILIQFCGRLSDRPYISQTLKGIFEERYNFEAIPYGRLGKEMISQGLVLMGASENSDNPFCQITKVLS